MDGSVSVFMVGVDAATRQCVAELGASLDFATRSFVNGAEFLATYDERQPGCIVLNHRPAEVDGLEIVAWLAERVGICPPVIMVAEQVDVATAVAAMRAGAFHFLLQPVHATVLTQALSQALEVDRLARLKVAARLDRLRRLGELTPEELHVMQRLVQGATADNIAKEIQMSLRSVFNRRAKLFAKLDVKSLRELIEFDVRLRAGSEDFV